MISPAFALKSGKFFQGSLNSAVQPQEVLSAATSAPWSLKSLKAGRRTDSQPGLDLGFCEGRPEHVQGARAESRGTELFASAGVQVELDGIAVPELPVAADVGWFLVEAFQADVQVVVVPEVEELPAPVGEIGVADMNRGDESTVPVGQLAVEFQGFLGLGDQADDGLVLGVGGSSEKQEDGSDTKHVFMAGSRD